MSLAINYAPLLKAAPETIRETLTAGTELLSAAGIESARLDAEVLLRHALSIDKTELYVRLDFRLDGDHQRAFRSLLLRRARHEPIAYIIGRQEFWSLDFNVTPDVLIPRPETERLVESALATAADFPADLPMRILDVGTGSGALAVSLAKEMPKAQILASDLSLTALAVARGNAARHRVAERVNFIGGDLFEGIATGRFTVIVSNPPYVRRAELATLAPEVNFWEPHLALDGGADGLDYYRRIADQAYSYLVAGGALLVEIGSDMAEQVAKLFTARSQYAPARVVRDYAGRDRVVAVRRIPSDLV